jgi:regulator of protease activity HflC (stomatin/prohibitin superfamily)
LPSSKIILKFSSIAFVLLMLVNLTLVKVGGQEVGVVVTPSGVSKDELKTGWHIVAPWNTVAMMDKTVWVYTLTSNPKEGAKASDDAIWAPTSDGIKMGFDISVNWHIDADEASWIYANISGDQDKDGRYHWIEENIIRPAIKSIMPLTVSRFTPIECYSEKRNDIQNMVQNALKKELHSSRIVVDMSQIREVYYNKDYEASINAKKLAEQEVLRLVQVTKQKEEQLKQADIDKNMAIAKAEGEAKSLQIKGDAINKNPKIVQLEWINKWDGSLPNYMMGGGQNVMLNLGDAK